jgi:transposase-like protein
MRRKRFTEEQIIGILKEAEAGAKSTDLCRQHGISEQTFYCWKAEYAGLEVNESTFASPAVTCRKNTTPHGHVMVTR